MKNTLIWIMAAVALGGVGGAALGYWEARPWTMKPVVASSSSAPGGDATGVAPAGQPRANIAETTYNFDKMESGTKQKRSFPVKNTGPAPLSVEFLSHTCKCTTIELNGKPVEEDGQKVAAHSTIIIPPGGEGKIMLEWVAQAEPGPFRHGASFGTNDPALERLELTIEGEVVSSTTLQPTVLNFGAVPAGVTGQADLFVMSLLEPEVQILSHEIVGDKLAERLKLSIEPAAKDELPNPDAKAGVKIVAHYDAAGTLGPFAGLLRLTTNLKQASSLEVPVTGMVKGDISIVGGKQWTDQAGLLRLDPATSASGTSVRLTIIIRGEHANDTELRVAKADPPELKATLGERRNLRENVAQIPLTVEVPPGTRPMVYAGADQGGDAEIVLATTHPVTPEVRLRVHFTIKP